MLSLVAYLARAATARVGVMGATPIGRTMPTRKPPPIPRPTPADDARVGGILDDIGGAFQDGGKWIYEHGDQIADVAEVVVPMVAPYLAPAVAAEHALRKGIELNQAQAKAATTGMTAVGKAVAAQQMAQATGDSGTGAEPQTSGGATLQLAVNRGKAPPSSSSSSSGLLLIAGIGLLLLLSGEL